MRNRCLSLARNIFHNIHNNNSTNVFNNYTNVISLKMPDTLYINLFLYYHWSICWMDYLRVYYLFFWCQWLPKNLRHFYSISIHDNFYVFWTYFNIYSIFIMVFVPVRLFLRYETINVKRIIIKRRCRW